MALSRSASVSRRRRSQSVGRRGRGGRVVARRGVVRGYKGLAARKGGGGLRGVRKENKFKRGGGVGQGGSGKKKNLPVSKETLDMEIDSFMKGR